MGHVFSDCCLDTSASKFDFKIIWLSSNRNIHPQINKQTDCITHRIFSMSNKLYPIMKLEFSDIMTPMTLRFTSTFHFIV